LLQFQLIGAVLARGGGMTTPIGTSAAREVYVYVTALRPDDDVRGEVRSQLSGIDKRHLRARDLDVGDVTGCVLHAAHEHPLLLTRDLDDPQLREDLIAEPAVYRAWVVKTFALAPDLRLVVTLAPSSLKPPRNRVRK